MKKTQAKKTQAPKSKAKKPQAKKPSPKSSLTFADNKPAPKEFKTLAAQSGRVAFLIQEGAGSKLPDVWFSYIQTVTKRMIEQGFTITAPTGEVFKL